LASAKPTGDYEIALFDKFFDDLKATDPELADMCLAIDDEPLMKFPHLEM